MSEAAVVDDGALIELAQRLRARLGPLFGVACTDVNGDPGRLYPEERAWITRAIPRRQREYAAGRRAARQAMSAIGWPAAPVPSAPDRSPVWPCGLTGSIAHTRSTCVAVVARSKDIAAIGIDVEDDLPLAADLWPLVCTPAELAFLHARPPERRGALATRLFTAKEAFYKWQFPQTGQMLDFQDVQVELDMQAMCFDAHPSPAKRVCVPALRGAGQLLFCGEQLLAWFATPTNHREPGHTCSPTLC